MQVTESMRRDIFIKNEKLAELQTELARQETAATAKLEAQKSELEEKLGQQESAAQEAEDKLQGEVDSLTRELADLEAFTRAKEDLERSQLAMRAENDALKAKLDKAEQEEERRYIHGTMTLKREFEQKSGRAEEAVCTPRLDRLLLRNHAAQS